MKNFINGFGTCFAIFTAIGFAAFVWQCYPKTEHGYAPEHRAELQNKINNLVPLSLADLGE